MVFMLLGLCGVVLLIETLHTTYVGCKCLAAEWQTKRQDEQEGKHDMTQPGQDTPVGRGVIGQ